MAQIVKELRVDVSQPNVFQAIVAKQNDSNSRFLKITLVDFGVKVEVPNTAKVTINANRPDGASESFKGEANNDGTITVPLAQWMLDIDGEVKCDVSVINTEDNKRLTSTDFWLEVQKAANPNASIPLDPDGEILIIKPVTEINENSKDTDYPSAKAVYDYGQDILADTKVTATSSGSAITIESANAPLQSLKLYGKTTQDGTPTPTEPKELKSVGDSGSFEVGVYGKNFLEITQPTQLLNGITYTVNGDGSITASGTCSGYSTFHFTPNAEKNLIKGHTYKVIYGGIEMIKVGGSKEYFIDKPFTYDDTVTSISVYRQYKDKTVNETFYPMIVLADETDLSFEKFKAKQSLTTPYTLRSVGGVKDEVDFARGVFIRRCARLLITETFGLSYDTNNARFYKYGGTGANGWDTTKISSHYVIGETGSASIGGKDKTFSVGENAVYIKDTRFTNVTDFNNWLASNNVSILYRLTTPQETPLTETELNAYRQLMTNSGTTTILSEADMEVDYYVNKPNAQAIGNIHTQINKDYLKLQQAIISTGGSTL